MRRGRLLVGAVVGSVVAATALAVSGPAGASAAVGESAPTASSNASTDYVVLYRAGESSAAGRAAIVRAGGVVVRENTEVGYALVRTSQPTFAAKADTAPELDGAARNRAIGSVPKEQRNRADAIEKLPAERAASRGQGGGADVARQQAAVPTGVAPEPLANRQWDMRQIGATPTGSYAVNQGKRGVLVGVIDTGIDGTHPDIAPNFDAALSHNFTVDMPVIDGPCEVPTCIDPANVDDNGHGTHVASTIGSPINGLGIAGVAPNVTLVNLRAGQDSGYFFLQSVLEALTYAGDIGVDVVNMSFYTDPWLFNCVHNPADSPAEQAEQRVIRTATQRALNYALHHGVLPVAAAGNEATDLGHPTSDDTSPDFPADAAKHRDIDNSCITVPTESAGVLVVSSTGITTRKAYYSNYGTEQTDVAAPGGDYYDSADNTGDPRNLVLAAYPKRLAELQRPAQSRRHSQHAIRGGGLRGHRLRLLPVSAGHLHGRATRGRRRSADRQPFRQEIRQRTRPESGDHQSEAEEHGDRARLPITAAVPVHPSHCRRNRGPSPGTVLRIAERQRLLRRRDHQRLHRIHVLKPPLSGGDWVHGIQTDHR